MWQPAAEVEPLSIDLRDPFNETWLDLEHGDEG